MSDKRRLGKGLGALIPEAVVAESEIKEVSLERIKPNPYQPRATFDEEKLRELSNSIKEHGVVQAIVVSPAGGGYHLVAGERRFRAAQIAGLQTIPAVIRMFKPSAMLEIALIENLQREDLSPIEEATAYRRLMEEFNFTQEDLARRMGKSRPAIANTVRLLALHPLVKEAMARGEITAGQARPLLAIQDRARQEEAGLQVIAKGMTAREVEKMVTELGQTPQKTSKEKGSHPIDPHQREIQEQLQRHLGTKVIVNNNKGGGCIQVHFYGDEDLNRLLSLILPGGIS